MGHISTLTRTHVPEILPMPLQTKRLFVMQFWRGEGIVAANKVIIRGGKDVIVAAPTISISTSGADFLSNVDKKILGACTNIIHYDRNICCAQNYRETRK